ncbi:MAG: hypothetical protein L0Z55_03350 [Planctomycetes bacterium]|nr:hypothetical protein [Planctomycetota bacterium]
MILGQDKDSAYAIRNVFDMERFELELALQLDVAKTVLQERFIDLIILDPAIALEESFDLIDFQLDHGLEVPILMVGGESTGVRRKVRSKKGIKVFNVPADGFKLLAFVHEFSTDKIPS